VLLAKLLSNKVSMQIAKNRSRSFSRYFVPNIIVGHLSRIYGIFFLNTCNN